MTEALFLRQIDGRPLGPVPPQAMAVLFGTRVIDEQTPVSTDGATFRPLQEQAELLAVLRSARDRIVNGQVPDPPPARGATLEASLSGPLDGRPLGTVLFEAARRAARGTLAIMTSRGGASLGYQDGKVVRLEVGLAELALPRYLLETGVVDADAIATAEAELDRFGGDFGGALIGLGRVQPHTYIEAHGGWAKSALSTLAGLTQGATTFRPEDVRAQPIPLGFDRYGAIVEAIRTLGVRWLVDRMGPGAGPRPVIPRTVEGVTLDDLKLQPKELRVMRGIDGAKTVEALMSAGEHAAVALGIGLSLGFAVLGDDPDHAKERAEALKLEVLYAQLSKKNQLDLLGVKPDAADADVRSRYMDLAKQFHPDGIRAHAAPELLAVREKLFALAQSAFASVETAEQRQSLGKLKGMGFEGRIDEQAVVRGIIEAEMSFRKAETFARMKRYGEALAEVQQAVRKKPDEIEYRIHESYYTFLGVSGPGQAPAAARALEEIGVLLKKRSDIVTGHVFIARLHKTLGNEDACLKAYKRVLDLDSKNHEAESELRLANLRAQKSGKKKWP